MTVESKNLSTFLNYSSHLSNIKNFHPREIMYIEEIDNLIMVEGTSDLTILCNISDFNKNNKFSQQPRGKSFKFKSKYLFTIKHLQEYEHKQNIALIFIQSLDILNLISNTVTFSFNIQGSLDIFWNRSIESFIIIDGSGNIYSSHQCFGNNSKINKIMEIEIEESTYPKIIDISEFDKSHLLLYLESANFNRIKNASRYNFSTIKDDAHFKSIYIVDVNDKINKFTIKENFIIDLFFSPKFSKEKDTIIFANYSQIKLLSLSTMEIKIIVKLPVMIFNMFFLRNISCDFFIFFTVDRTLGFLKLKNQNRDSNSSCISPKYFYRDCKNNLMCSSDYDYKNMNLVKIPEDIIYCYVTTSNDNIKKNDGNLNRNIFKIFHISQDFMMNEYTYKIK